ncbi:MAG: FGGY-family carbohydrate kinase [Candidatus Choladocola sp.]|nr:FGGY-family carbohydrate kinase [Candidatus Choladocola sp.]
MKKYLLSVDNGGTYIKAAIFDRYGKQLAMERQYNELLRPAPGLTEYDQKTLWEINCMCMRNVIRTADIDPSEIACIGIAGQGCGFYAVDREGNDIRHAISSSDSRANEIVEKWHRAGLCDQVYTTIYRDIASGHLNALLAWMKENETESYKKIYRLFSMKDFLIYRLTGAAIAGYGCQSASNLMDMKKKEISFELADIYGIPEMADKFGELYWDIQICGSVTEKAAEACGCLPGTLVSAGSHDVVATAIAMGITDSDLCFMITGTHGINGYISEKPVLNGSVKYNELFAFPGKYLLEEGYPSSSATLEWVISVLFSETDKKINEIYNIANQEVASVKPQDSSLVFLPFLRGHRDNPNAAGAWLGLRPEHTRAHMLRAVYEGVVFSHMLQMKHLLSGRERPAKIRLAGGATASNVWVQIFADAFDVPMEIVPNEEMGAKGAAIVAATAAGFYPDICTAVKKMTCVGKLVNPIAENVPIYAEKFERFHKAVHTMDTAGNGVQ